jgi:hypothetical protein
MKHALRSNKWREARTVEDTQSKDYQETQLLFESKEDI